MSQMLKYIFILLSTHHINCNKITDFLSNLTSGSTQDDQFNKIPEDDDMYKGIQADEESITK